MLYKLVEVNLDWSVEYGGNNSSRGQPVSMNVGDGRVTGDEFNELSVRAQPLWREGVSGSAPLVPTFVNAGAASNNTIQCSQLS